MNTIPELLPAVEALNNKRLDALCRKLAKKMSFRSAADLTNLRDLCYWLYIYGHTDLLGQFYPVMLSIDFTGNWNTWTWVESMLALLHYAAGRQPDADAAAQQAREKLLGAYTGSACVALERLRTGEGLAQARRESDEEMQAPASQALLRETLLCELHEALLVHAAGGCANCPQEQLEARIEELCSLLRTLK